MRSLITTYSPGFPYTVAGSLRPKWSGGVFLGPFLSIELPFGPLLTASLISCSVQPRLPI